MLKQVAQGYVAPGEKVRSSRHVWDWGSGWINHGISDAAIGYDQDENAEYRGEEPV